MQLFFSRRDTHMFSVIKHSHIIHMRRLESGESSHCCVLNVLGSVCVCVCVCECECVRERVCVCV